MEKQKTKTSHALCAQAIRKELKEKFPKTKFKIRSEGYSMGNNVSISWVEGPKEKEIEEITDKYQQGHFDGMTDLYEYSNRNLNLPQVKYVFTRRLFSFESMEKIVEMFNTRYGFSVKVFPCGNHYAFPEVKNYQIENTYLDRFHCHASQDIYRFMREENI